MVFDKQGRFVDGLKPEQFQLFVDGKPQSVSFFERVAAGSASEEAQLAAARGGGTSLEKGVSVNPLDRGRVIFFLVDDLHILPTDMRTRKPRTVYRRGMGQNDQIAITSATDRLLFPSNTANNKPFSAALRET